LQISVNESWLIHLVILCWEHAVLDANLSFSVSVSLKIYWFNDQVDSQSELSSTCSHFFDVDSSYTYFLKVDLKIMILNSILNILTCVFAVNNHTDLFFLFVFLKRSNFFMCVMQSLFIIFNFSREDFLISFLNYLSHKSSVDSSLHMHRCIVLFQSKNQLSFNNVFIIYHHIMYLTVLCSRENQAIIRRNRKYHAFLKLFVSWYSNIT